MAYITDDPDVKKIIQLLRQGAVTEQAARREIEAMPPDPGKAFNWRPWEVDEAIKAARQ